MPSTIPTTIIENNRCFTVNNARPLAMRVLVGFAAPIVFLFIAVAIVNDVEERAWGMLAIRLMFAFTVGLATRFALFGAETIGFEDGELVWRRGRSLERHCPVGAVDRIEREGNQLRVHIRDDKYPIIVGAGLRQSEAAMAWLAERLETLLTEARTGT
ncbi:MAG TPA: hypothetical protein VIA18_15280 [Polyangia bacterium]|jgi:hypothetical protein|nr:hypothetical protein [Polyangia bacterium]HWE29054.1 hypothetical protein [Polyangia bacterium]